MAGLIPNGALVRLIGPGANFPMVGPTIFAGPGVRRNVTLRLRIFSLTDLGGAVAALNQQGSLVLEEFVPALGVWNPVLNGSQAFDGIAPVPPDTNDFTLVPTFTQEQVRWTLTLTNNDAVNPWLCALLWSLDVD